ncbi:unnamed protein product [Musa acuminata var. zebrina]
MGTKVQCKSYLPGYPISDLHEDANYSWSRFSEDKTFSRQMHNNFKLRGVSSWLDYDKEMLKRTMLEHEAIFQRQVFELHRLYRTQKELMHDFKKKNLNEFSGPMVISRSSMFASQMHPEFSESVWHLPPPPLLSTCQSTANVTDVDDRRNFLNFLEESATQCNSISAKNGGFVKDDRPKEAKLSGFPRRILDLHLPADAYIENEDTEHTEGKIDVEPCAMAAETINMIHGIEADNEVKLSLGSVEVPGFGKGALKLNLHSRNGLPIHSFADLNEPTEDSCERGTVGSGSCKFNGLNVDSKQLQKPWTTMRSKTSSPHTNPFMDKHGDQVVSSSYLNVDRADKGQEQQVLHNNCGQSKIAVSSYNSGLFNEKFPLSCGSIKLTLDTTQESHIPIAVQALPGSSASSMLNGQSKSYNAVKQSNNVGCEKVPCNVDLQPQLRLDNKFSSNVNGLHHGSQMNSTSLTGTHLLPCNLRMQSLGNNSDTSEYANSEIHEPRKCLKSLHFVDVKYAKDVQSNQAILCCSQSDLTDRQKLIRKHYESSKGIIWHREKPSPSGSTGIKECDTRLDLQFSRDYSQLIFTEFTEGVKDEGPSIFAAKQPMPSFDIKESRIQTSQTSDSLNSKRIFCLPENSCRNFSYSNSISYDVHSLADDAKDYGKGKAGRNFYPGLRNDINLNSDLTPIIDPQSFRMSAEGETQIPPSFPWPRVAGKPTCKIDLEAPADELEEENTFSGAKLVDINYSKTTVEISQEKISSQDPHVILAADAIVSMSMNVHKDSDKVARHPFAPSSCDSLYMLAELVTHDAESKGSGEGNCDASEDDGLDVFESMTLKLEELKADEYCCKPCRQEKPEDEKSMAALLLTKPRRGQARRRRQRRDFQKDVLPALASLSRHEVTEDLQALGGVTRSGKSWQISSARSTCQNSASFQTRGRRRPRDLAITAVEVTDSPPRTQPIHSELENDGRNIMAWGRTTRRCRRQRMPSGNAPAPQG